MFMCPFLGDCPTFLQHINQSIDTCVLFNRNIVFFSTKIGNQVSALETKFYKVVWVVFFFFLSAKHG